MIIKHILLLTVTIGFFIQSGVTNAHDLGTQGQVFRIQEIDIRMIMAKEFSQLNVLKLQDVISKSVHNYTSHLSQAPLTTVSKTFTYYVDPSIALKRKIAWQGHTIYHKGTWVNPLRVVRPHTNMLFFDARNPEQSTFALKLLKQHPYDLLLVATGGDPAVIAKKINRPVYYAFKPIVDRFDIRHVPSMLGVGQGKHHLQLSVMNFADNDSYSTRLANVCWHGCSREQIDTFLKSERSAYPQVHSSGAPRKGAYRAVDPVGKPSKRLTLGQRLGSFLNTAASAVSGTANALDVSCKGRFLNPVTDIEWNDIFPIRIAGVPVKIGAGSGESPISYTSPVCLCPGRLGGIPTPGLEVTFHEPLYIEEIAKAPGCMSSIGGVSMLPGYSEEATDLKEDANSSSRWQVHWYEYPVFAVLKLFQDFSCVQGGGFALAYMTELDPTWQNDEWGAVFSPEALIFANPIAQSACAADAVAATAQAPLDPLFWCAGAWGGVYPFTGNANASAGRQQSAELVGAKMMARLARTGFLWDSVGPWAMCSPLPDPIWIKSEFSLDPVYPMIREGAGMSIGAPTPLWMTPPQTYPSTENLNQVVFQEQQCRIHV